MNTRLRIASVIAAAASALVLVGCGGGDESSTTAPTTTAAEPTSTSSPTQAPGTATSTAPSGSPSTPTASPTPTAPGTTPPPWLGTRVLPRTADGFGEVRPTPAALRNRRFTLPDTVAPLPGDGFASRIASPAPAAVIARSTWKRGCPVGRGDLAWVRLTFWGFDDARHTGELLVAADVARDVVRAFRRLYAARFPIEEMRITRAAELDAPPTGDGNNTGAFACRPTRGTTTFSEHAYGRAIDINPFQNPYHRGDVVLPELASSYLDRDDVRPGMITADGPVVSAFAAIGWGWGGSWRTLKDYQHVSSTGR